MTARIQPCLWYDGNAEEAAAFYASIFPDSRIDRVWALPAESPSGPPGSVKVVDFTLCGQRFQALTSEGIRTFEADFVQSLKVPLLGTDTRSTGKLYQRRPDRFAMRQGAAIF